MVRKFQSELSTADIKFLKKVREVEDHPDKFPLAEQTEGRANTSILRKNLDMTEAMIRYRLVPGERGLEELDLVRLFDPEVNDDGTFGPRSVELTETGRLTLDDWEERHGGMDTGVSKEVTTKELKADISRLESKIEELEAQTDRAADADGQSVAELREELSQLESRVDALTDVVHDFQDSEYGAIDESIKEAVRNISAVTSGMVVLWRAIGGPDPLEIPQDDIPDELVTEIREDVAETLVGDLESIGTPERENRQA